MAERKQVNKYYPPDFDPKKHKNLNKYRNTHALRERAKKIDQGILVIRFEMPYDIWCEGCKIHIAMGVRYNAEKRKVGYYYTTPILRFRMKCHLCDNYFEIETDPKNCNYKIIIGAQRKNEKWDMAQNEQVLTEDREVVKKLAADAMFKLEHGVEDQKKLKRAAPTLSEIVDIQSSWNDDYIQNRILRDKFRKEKKEIKEEKAKDTALLQKSSLDIKLVPESEEDKKLASLLKYQTTSSFDEKEQLKRSEIQNQSIFTASTTLSSSPVGEKDPKYEKVSKLQKHLEKTIKMTAGGGFGSFEPAMKRRKTTSVPGIIVKRKKSVNEEEMKTEGMDTIMKRDELNNQSLVVTEDNSDRLLTTVSKVGQTCDSTLKICDAYKTPYIHIDSCNKSVSGGNDNKIHNQNCLHNLELSELPDQITGILSSNGRDHSRIETDASKDCSQSLNEGKEENCVKDYLNLNEVNKRTATTPDNNVNVSLVEDYTSSSSSDPE